MLSAQVFEAWQPRSLAILCFTIFAVFINLIFRRWSIPHDDREPPLVLSRIPIFGHLIQFLKHGMHYLSMLDDKYHLPIYALDIMGRRTYVVSSPELAVAVQRNSKTLSFVPLIIEISRRLVNIDKTAHGQIAKNQFGDEPGFSYMKELHDAQYRVLTPGHELDHMNVYMLQRMTPLLNDLRSEKAPKFLLAYLRHLFMIAGTYAAYGPASPFEGRPDLEDAMWDFGESVPLLIMDIMPDHTVRKGAKGRAKLVKAFQAYYRTNGQKTASALIRERYRVAAGTGMKTDDIARLEVGLMFGLLVNAIPTSFWLICYIFSHPTLLKELRQELHQIYTRTEPSDKQPSAIEIQVPKIRQSCPLLSSTYQEVLRLISSHSTGRQVVKDTVLADRYLLKEGAIVTIPAGVIHNDTRVWGPDAREFKPRRFIETLEAERTYPGAFRSFGGGKTLCPGRFFAFNEILSFTALVIIGFEVEPKGKEWVLPKQDSAKIPLGVSNPASDLEVRFRPRVGFEEMEWRFKAVDEIPVPHL